MNAHDAQGGAEGDLSAVSVPSPEVTRLALHLMAVRSAVLVGVYLNERFPTEELFTDFLNSAETIEGLTAFAETRDDILESALASGGDSALVRSVMQNHTRALEAVDVLAERIGVAPEDLFAFLLRA